MRYYPKNHKKYVTVSNIINGFINIRLISRYTIFAAFRCGGIFYILNNEVPLRKYTKALSVRKAGKKIYLWKNSFHIHKRKYR